ncbi:cation transporter [Saccharibacillus sp. CPCC 101409]|uniref:cation diffusion facilitator family transporter n=1 Tax=Saccharibacillus sp. CPCC 101409 TaxID=3058041 RepID=UPI0026732284|nr:cation transporter [Saccharibacillus sp. CPCC 101409]MDO3409006.1 cation transporter [Saccharibacillus sp. CPCC 101409]
MTPRQQQFGNSARRAEAFGLGAAALIKGIGGYIGGSPSLLADALNSAADAFRGSTPKHTAGRAALTKALLSVLILVGALEAAIAGVHRMLRTPEEAPGTPAVAAFFLAVLLVLALFILRYRSLQRTDSAAAGEYAAEHRLSLYASFLVAAGMAASIAGSGFDIPEMMYAEPAASFLVAVIAVIKAIRLLLGVLEESPDARKAQPVDPTPFTETVQRVRGVIEVRELQAAKESETVSIDLVLSVNPRMTVKEAEEVANRSRDLLMNRFVQVIEVKIRIEPYHTGYPYKSNEELPDSEQPTIVQ